MDENDQKITGDEFHEILKKIIEEKVSVDNLLSILDVYECLCEEYNNEVLEVWEQRKSQNNQREENLFAFTLHERTGEKEFTLDRLVKAMNIEEAEKKARKYCARWYPSDPTYQYNKRNKVHIFDAGTCYVTAVDLQKVEKKDWMQRMYREVLIG